VPDDFRPFVIPPRHPARRQLEAGWELYLAIGREPHSNSTERIQHIVSSLLVRVWRLYRSALTLAVDGFGPESESMSRAMYESNLTALWAMFNPVEAVARFDLHIDYMFHLQHEQQPTDEVISPMNAVDRDQAIKWFGQFGERPWCGKTIRELDGEVRAILEASDIGDPLAGYIDTVHRWMNWNLHGSPINLMRVANITGAGRVFDVAPGERDIEDALKYGGIQLTLSIVALSILNATPTSPELMKRIFEVWRSWNPTAYTAGRNDACPCGSGKKYKLAICCDNAISRLRHRAVPHGSGARISDLYSTESRTAWALR
jgi:Family of unknown function (DUF5677)/SEC-C motif